MVQIAISSQPANDRRLLLDTGLCLFGGAVALAGLASAIAAEFRLGLGFGVAALLLYGAVSSVVLSCIRAFHPFRRFGLPNLVTLGRAVLVCLFAGVATAGPTPLDPAVDRFAWLFVGLAVAALAMDGLDGLAARCRGLASRFGARFDMEIDALFILLLSILASTGGKAGIWVLAIGAMRYLFVAAGMALPILAAPLPSSLRRKAVCVLQIAALCALLTPSVQPPLSVMLAVGALLALVYSFAADVLWLLRTGGTIDCELGRPK